MRLANYCLAYINCNLSSFASLTRYENVLSSLAVAQHTQTVFTGLQSFTKKSHSWFQHVFPCVFPTETERKKTRHRCHCPKLARACVCVFLEIIDSCDRSICRHFSWAFHNHRAFLYFVNTKWFRWWTSKKKYRHNGCWKRPNMCPKWYTRHFVHAAATFTVHKSTNIFQIIKLIIVIDGYGVFIRQLHSGSS